MTLSPDHLAGFIHGMIWGTNWPHPATARKIHSIMLQSLKPEVLKIYEELCKDEM